MSAQSTVDIKLNVGGNAAQDLKQLDQIIADLNRRFATLKANAGDVNLRVNVDGAGQGVAGLNRLLAQVNARLAALNPGVHTQVNAGMAPARPVPTFQEKVSEAVRRKQEREAIAAEVKRRTGPQGFVGKAGAFLQSAGKQGFLGATAEALGPEAAGALGVAGGAAAAGAAVYLGATAALGKTAEVMDVFTDETKTSAQKMRALSELLVPGAASINHFIDALDGTANRVKMAGLRFELDAQAVQQRFQVARTLQEGEAQVAHYQSRAAAFAAVEPIAVPQFDRGTRAGEVAYREWASLVPYRGAAARARAEAEAAGGEQAASAARLRQLRRVRDEKDAAAVAAVERRKGVERYEERTGIRSEAARTEAGYAAEKAINEALAAQKQVRAEIERQRELGLQHAQAEHAVRQADLGIARQELALLEQKEARMTSAARRVGAMAPYERRLGLQAVQLVRQYGVDSVPLDVRRRAETFAPELIGKMEEVAGFRSGEFQQLQRIDPAIAGSVQAVREEIAQKAVHVEFKISLDNQKTAEEVAKFLRPLIPDIVREITAEQKQEQRLLKEGQIRAHYNH